MGDIEARNSLQRQLETNTNMSNIKRERLTARLNELNEDLAANPVKPLIDEGIFQTITEDIDMTESIYSNREKLMAKAQPYIDKTPEGIVDAYKIGYMTHDTPAYKLLLRGTQYSDFVARYTLYQHHLRKAEAKAKKITDPDERQAFLDQALEVAIGDIIETFINYDVPTSQFMQYMNDMGIIMFTKFHFRIQKQIFKLFTEKPATALGMYSLQNMFGDVADITDSNFLTRGIITNVNGIFDTFDSATYMGGVELGMNTLDPFIPD
jgi:hypothetical protein